MRPEKSDVDLAPFSIKQKLILTFFFLEVLIYPFIVAMQLEGGELEPELENRIVQRGLQIFFIWVPIALISGFFLGRRLQKNPKIIEFFRDHDISPDEVAPIFGVFTPLAIITALLVVRMTVICFQLFFITIPLYLVIRHWKKKGIRNLLGWIFGLVIRISIRLKRISYIGYFLPILFGVFFAKNITRNTEAQSGGTYILILIQMVILVALWRFIRKPQDSSSTQEYPSDEAVESGGSFPYQVPQPPPISPAEQPFPDRTPPLPSQRTLPEAQPPPLQPPPVPPPLPNRPLPASSTVRYQSPGVPPAENLVKRKE